MTNQNPEQLARDIIDKQLLQCGWLIQSNKFLNLTCDFSQFRTAGIVNKGNDAIACKCPVFIGMFHNHLRQIQVIVNKNEGMTFESSPQCFSALFVSFHFINAAPPPSLSSLPYHIAASQSTCRSDNQPWVFQHCRRWHPSVSERK